MAEQSEGLEETEIIEDSQEVEQEVETQSEESVQEEQKQTKSQNAKQRLRRKLREAESARLQAVEENRQLSERLNSIEEKLNTVANPPPKRPSRVEYETDEDYEDALFEWRDAKLPKPEPQPVKPVKPVKNVEKQEELPEVDPKVLRNWQDQIDEASDKYDDFEEALVSIPPESMTEAMTLAIMESEDAGEIAYFLGNNHKEAARIANLNIAAQIREIDKLSHKFTPKQTKAPPPINPEKGGDSPTKDPEKMTPEEYRDWRRKSGMGY